MSECHRIAERLAAYADESLPAESGADVERHLHTCASCRTAASHEREAHAVLHAHAASLRPEPPPGLRSRCEALASEHVRARVPPAWRGRVVLVAVAAILIAFTGVAIVSLATQRSAALLAGQLTADHTRCFGSFVSPDPRGLALQEVEASHVALEVEASLAAQHGREIHLPPSSSAADVRLVHARRCPYAERQIPHLL